MQTQRNHCLQIRVDERLCWNEQQLYGNLLTLSRIRRHADAVTTTIFLRRIPLTMPTTPMAV